MKTYSNYGYQFVSVPFRTPASAKYTPEFIAARAFWARENYNVQLLVYQDHHQRSRNAYLRVPVDAKEVDRSAKLLTFQKSQVTNAWLECLRWYCDPPRRPAVLYVF